MKRYFIVKRVNPHNASQIEVLHINCETITIDRRWAIFYNQIIEIPIRAIRIAIPSDQIFSIEETNAAFDTPI